MDFAYAARNRKPTMRLYNTLTQQKEPFSTIEPGKARIYVCGPTVYDYAHIGHARCYVVYDVLVRYLRHTGLDVMFVRNVTDVDDKIINRAREKSEEPTELAERFREAYVEDMHRLGNIDPDVEPKVSEHMQEIIQLVQDLIEKGYAYEADGDVYFNVAKFPSYGKLSHRKLEDMMTGASGRTETEEQGRKQHPFDFALWKGTEEGETSWPSPWGKGRPGWHIECSAMSMKYLGASFDLHGGGLDLVFPHHENEIAQSEAANGCQYVGTWMHNGFVQVNKEKMSKSLGNFFVIREVFRHVEPEAMRYALLTMHYRSPFNLEWDNNDAGELLGFPQFEEAENRLQYLYDTRLKLKALPQKRIVDLKEPAPKEIAEYAARLGEALADDMNTPIGLAHTAELLSAVNQVCDQAMVKKGKANAATVEAAKAALATLGNVLGLGTDNAEAFLARIRDRRAKKLGIDTSQVDHQIISRNEARRNKDYARADAIRDELAELGVEMFDTPDGTSWRLAGSSGGAGKTAN